MRLTENRFHPGHLLLVATVVVTCLVETRLQASPKRRTPIVEAYERVSHAVVNIHGRKRLPADTIVSAEDFRQVNGMGTGVVIDERGYILTNSHVVDGVANIQVSFVDETSTTARLVANDPASDLAVIKINLDRKFPAIPVGTSHDLMRGEPVIAIGNAFGYTHTVSNGIISALHRSVKISDTQEYRNLIQTNASINPGNSGGPLLNIDGEMIGINVAVRVGAQGIGFALPVDDAMQVAAKLLTTRRIDDTTHGVIGETVREGTLAEAKFVVKRVESGSPAAKAGLKKGDVVVEVDRREIVRSLDFERALLGREQGEEIPVQVDRQGSRVKISLVLTRSSGSPNVVNSRTWNALGMQLTPIPGTIFENLGTRYRGGLRIDAVRNDSPADRQGIRRGDILVGLHKWETISLENVAYILDSDEFSQLQPVKFFILRGTDTLHGHLSVARR